MKTKIKFLFQNIRLIFRYSREQVYFEVKHIIQEDPLNIKIRKFIRGFFNSDLNNIPKRPKVTDYITLGVTDLVVVKEKDRIKIILIVERPGLVIGKAGLVYESFKKELSEELGIKESNIELDIRESRMWRNLYT
jgi:hypothetical protein